MASVFGSRSHSSIGLMLLFIFVVIDSCDRIGWCQGSILHFKYSLLLKVSNAQLRFDLWSIMYIIRVKIRLVNYRSASFNCLVAFFARLPDPFPIDVEESTPLPFQPAIVSYCQFALGRSLDEFTYSATVGRIYLTSTPLICAYIPRCLEIELQL